MAAIALPPFVNNCGTPYSENAVIIKVINLIDNGLIYETEVVTAVDGSSTPISDPGIIAGTEYLIFATAESLETGCIKLTAY